MGEEVEPCLGPSSSLGRGGSKRAGPWGGRERGGWMDWFGGWAGNNTGTAAMPSFPPRQELFFPSLPFPCPPTHRTTTLPSVKWGPALAWLKGTQRVLAGVWVPTSYPLVQPACRHQTAHAGPLGGTSWLHPARQISFNITPFPSAPRGPVVKSNWAALRRTQSNLRLITKCLIARPTLDRLTTSAVMAILVLPF